jgi:hypothetical protein
MGKKERCGHAVVIASRKKWVFRRRVLLGAFACAFVTGCQRLTAASFAFGASGRSCTIRYHLSGLV